MQKKTPRMKPRPQLIAFRYGNPCHSADLPAGQPADEKNSVHSRPGQCLTVTIVGACFNAEFSQSQIKHDFRISHDIEQCKK
jgi:hypothetical protein